MTVGAAGIAPSVPGRVSLELGARANEVECPAFAQRRNVRPGADAGDTAPIVLARGEGATVEDVDGIRYVDLAAGFGAALLGHAHPAIVRAITEQSGRLIQGLGDVYASDVKVALLERLARLHPSTGAQVLLAQSGGDAIAAAMKTATLATGRHGFVAFDGAYHGLGYAPLAACGFQRGFREPFAPQLSQLVSFAPYPGLRGATMAVSLELVDDLLRASPTAAILVEPVLGRGGCVVPEAGFLRQLCRLAHDRGALVIADEIWTGLGRAGSSLVSVDEGASPDIVCLGKGLGGGVSIAAVVATRAAMHGWSRGETIHTSTHAGSPLACAAALATLDVLDADGLVARSRQLGMEAVASFRASLAGSSEVRDVRGRGLMIGIELDGAARAMTCTRELLRRGFLVLSGGIAGDTLVLTPPLTIDTAALCSLGPALAEVLAACR